MKRTLKLYSGDQGGTPGTPDRREKVKNFVVHIDEDDNASTQPQDDVPVYKGEVYFSSRPAKKTLGRFSLILRRSVRKDQDKNR